MSDFKFSVITNIYHNDNPGYFQTSLDSIFNQTIKANEIILVIDGEIPEQLNDVVISNENKIDKIIRLEKNVGLGIARKIGVESCKYDYIAIMDSDDTSVLNRFELQKQSFLEDEEIDIIGGQIREFNTDTDKIVGYRIVPESHNEIIDYIKKRCPLNHMTVMFKKQSVLNAGNYMDLHYNEDYYLWIRMFLKNSKFKNLNKILVDVRVNNNTYDRRGGRKYFKSEIYLQKYMRENNLISNTRYLTNYIKRFIIQIILPSKIRGLIFKKIARNKVFEE